MQLMGINPANVLGSDHMTAANLAFGNMMIIASSSSLLVRTMVMEFVG
jgi:hypothetical protein